MFVTFLYSRKAFSPWKVPLRGSVDFCFFMYLFRLEKWSEAKKKQTQQAYSNSQLEIRMLGL